MLWSREYWCPYICKVKHYSSRQFHSWEVPDLQLDLSPPLSTQTPTLFFIPSFSFSHLLSIPFHTFSSLWVTLPLLWGGKNPIKKCKEKKTLFGFIVSKMLEYGLLSPLSLCLWQHGKARKSAYLTAAKKGAQVRKRLWRRRSRKKRKLKTKWIFQRHSPVAYCHLLNQWFLTCDSWPFGGRTSDFLHISFLHYSS